VSERFEFTVPVLVVGGGACGAVAALTAREGGAQVLLVEQDNIPAGSTAMSQGLIAAAGTRAQAALGVEDNADIFYADIMVKTRGQTDPVIARAIANESGPTLDWLVEIQGLPWTLDTAFRAAYGNSRLRVHGWAGHGGRDMIQLLHRRLAEANVDVMTGAKLIDIHTDATGRAPGITVERPNGAHEQIGCETLILASGGFAANREMVAQFMPEAADARYHGHESNRGDGIVLGQQVGGAVGDMGSYQGYGMLTDPHGITVPPGLILEGGIIINTDGQRFINETADIGGMIHPVMAQPDGHCWVVYDAGIESRCAHIPETAALIELRAPRHADSIGELAERIGVNPDTLTATLVEARAMQIDKFGRNWADDRPPISPYRALRVVGALYHTQGGLQIDGEARVLRTDGSPLPNLFAGGGAARGVSGPSSWGYIPAMGLCAAVTLGRIAGRTAANQIERFSEKLR
jgi:fumarate reductase flavoprotein subunit